MASNEIALTRNGERVCPHCRLAKTPLRRMKGLLGRRALSADEGLLLEPASSVHTWFMRFPIDVVFLDRELRVLRIAENVVPWRFAAKRGARSALELPAGAAARAGLAVGDALSY
jgi:uncharacterized membrane protein (UPF0127 family)